MKKWFLNELRDTKLLLRSIPSIVVCFFTISVIMMNLLANKTLYQNKIIAIDGGILVSWVSFLCMDILAKHFGPKAANKVSIFAIGVNLLTCLIFFVASRIPSRGFESFDQVVGGTWFILFASTVAFISSAFLNNFLNWTVAKSFKNQDGATCYFVRSYVSTFISQFFDNFIFAILTFMVFAPIFWNGFHWTFIQCLMCSLLGAGLEMLMEAIFSPIGYYVVRKWKFEGVGKEYFLSKKDR